MKKTPVLLSMADFPKELHALLQNANAFDSSCSSNAAVYYLDSGYYLKVDAAHELSRETEMAQQFFQRNLGVEVVDYISAERDYLITRSAVGEDLTHELDDPKRLCETLAQALRILHSQPILNAPVSYRQQRYFESAAGDMNGGFYDEHVLMERFRIQSLQEAWAIMQEHKGLLKNDCLIHGDACLPNVIARNGQFHTFIDLALAGVGERHIDLYWALWSLQFNLKTEQYTDYFLDAYGRENVILDMLRVVAAFEVFG